MSDTPTHIPFSNNKRRGHGRKVIEKHVTFLVDKFRGTKKSNHPDPEYALLDFIRSYRTEEGLMCYHTLTDEEVDALHREYEAQLEAESEDE